jgi:hypothetical protein
MASTDEDPNTGEQESALERTNQADKTTPAKIATALASASDTATDALSTIREWTGTTIRTSELRGGVYYIIIGDADTDPNVCLGVSGPLELLVVERLLPEDGPHVIPVGPGLTATAIATHLNSASQDGLSVEFYESKQS